MENDITSQIHRPLKLNDKETLRWTQTLLDKRSDFRAEFHVLDP